MRTPLNLSLRAAQRDIPGRRVFNRRVTTGLSTAALAIGLATAAPQLASADQIDDLLGRLPAGQISCEQARSYWTNEADYNSKASQARAVAAFHPRGGEIRDALNRIDEAANRCGLKGGGATSPAPGPAPAPAPAPAPSNQSQPAAQPAPQGQVITIPAAPGTPTIAVPLGEVATVIMPDLAALLRDLLGGTAANGSVQGSSL